MDFIQHQQGLKESAFEPKSFDLVDQKLNDELLNFELKTKLLTSTDNDIYNENTFFITEIMNGKNPRKNSLAKFNFDVTTEKTNEKGYSTEEVVTKLLQSR